MSAGIVIANRVAFAERCRASRLEAMGQWDASEELIREARERERLAYLFKREDDKNYALQKRQRSKERR